jgi:hypothetical protein
MREEIRKAGLPIRMWPEGTAWCREPGAQIWRICVRSRTRLARQEAARASFCADCNWLITNCSSRSVAADAQVIVRLQAEDTVPGVTGRIRHHAGPGVAM